MSSGDLIADRRFDFARDLQMRGDLEAAAELFEQAIEIVPGFASAWFALGGVREELGDRGAAIKAFRRTLVVDPDDIQGATLRLIRLGAEPIAAMPAAYVQTLFDQYAPKFDAALLGHLDYRAPDLLFAAVLAARCAAGRPAFFRRAIDLGCGTGLAARAFAREVGEFIGIDLSPRMIEHARATGLYARLDVADMESALAGEAEGSTDLVLAADAFVYLADLDPVLSGAARVLKQHGLLAFTAETHGGEGVILGERLRYAHASAHVRERLEASGLSVVSFECRWSRTEEGIPVPGLVVVAMRP